MVKKSELRTVVDHSIEEANPELQDNASAEGAAPIQTSNEAVNSAPNPFDTDSLRIDTSFIETAGVKKLLTTVPVYKPGRQEFVRPC